MLADDNNNEFNNSLNFSPRALDFSSNITPSIPRNTQATNNISFIPDRSLDNQKIVDLLIKKATSKITYEGFVSKKTYQEIAATHHKTQQILRKIISEAIGRDFIDY